MTDITTMASDLRQEDTRLLTRPAVERPINEAKAHLAKLQGRGEPPNWDEQESFCFLTREAEGVLRGTWARRGGFYPPDSLRAFAEVLAEAITLFVKHPTVSPPTTRRNGQSKASTTEEILASLRSRLDWVQEILSASKKA